MAWRSGKVIEQLLCKHEAPNLDPGPTPTTTKQSAKDFLNKRFIKDCNTPV
jgi:hypothetical protein